MQMKCLVLVTTLVFGLGCVVTGGVSMATDMGPAEMELKTAAAKKPAKFMHKKHQEVFECGDCHHTKTDDGVKATYEEGMEIKKCVTCHNKENMSNPKLNSFKLAGHGLCKECHKENKETAPTKCSGCHIK